MLETHQRESRELKNLTTLAELRTQLDPEVVRNADAAFAEEYVAYRYPVVVSDDGDPKTSLWVYCPDLPEMNSVGDTREAALQQAVEGVAAALSLYVDTRRAIPVPSQPKPRQPVVYLPALVEAKVALWNTLCERGMRKADLARLLGCTQPTVDKLLDMTHSSKIEKVEQALALLGKRLGVTVEAV